jgi:hypothetical protein
MPTSSIQASGVGRRTPSVVVSRGLAQISGRMGLAASTSARSFSATDQAPASAASIARRTWALPFRGPHAHSCCRSWVSTMRRWTASSTIAMAFRSPRTSRASSTTARGRDEIFRGLRSQRPMSGRDVRLTLTGPARRDAPGAGTPMRMTPEAGRADSTPCQTAAVHELRYADGPAHNWAASSRWPGSSGPRNVATTPGRTTHQCRPSCQRRALGVPPRPAADAGSRGPAVHGGVRSGRPAGPWQPGSRL